MASLAELRDRIDAFLTDRARLAHRHHLGASPGFALQALFRDYPELADPETFKRIDEAVRAEKTHERFLPGLRRIRALLLEALATSNAAPALEERAQAEAAGQVLLAHEALPFRDAMAQLIASENRDRRALLEQATARFLRDEEGPFERAIEAELDVVRRLGASDAAAFRKEVEGIDLDAWRAPAEQLLRATEDAYRDLLSYALRKIDPKLRVGGGGSAQWHDLLHLSTTPWLRTDFGLSDVVSASEDWLLALGFNPNGGQRIEQDLASASNRALQPTTFVLRAPQQVALVLRPLGGMRDALGFLEALGQAQQVANLDADAPVDERRLGDGAVPQTHGLLFAHLLANEAWLKRHLRLGRANAREGARVAAFLQLSQLRHACAALELEAALRARGPSREVADEFADRMAAALLVSVPAAFAFHDRAVHPDPERRLRAFALEARLTRRLQERFDEDFFRNPGAGRELLDLFRRGQRDDAEAIAQAISGSPLDLAEAGARLVRVMGA